LDFFQTEDIDNDEPDMVLSSGVSHASSLFDLPAVISSLTISGSPGERL
jgi:hypothetical protein